MKIRNGFVSNSSSSSFIIDNCKNISIKKLAIELYTFYVEQYKEYDNELYLNQFINNINSLKNKNTSITFQSVNEDTFIYKEDNKIYIDTCNNISWSEVIDKYDYNYNHNEGDRYNSNRKYYSPEYDLFINDFEYCYKCNSLAFKINNVKYCTKENKKELEAFNRFRKIKNIIKNEN